MIGKKIIKAIVEFLSRFIRPTNEDLVRQIILGTAALGLEKHEHVEFSPIKGTVGNFKLSGNGMPFFTYLVFEQKIMEFVRITVSVRKSDRIEFVARVESTDLEHHGKTVEVKDKYKEPFMRLATYLHDYFPITVDRGIRALPENRYQEKPMIEAGLGSIHLVGAPIDSTPGSAS